MSFLTDYATLQPADLDRRRAIVDALMRRPITNPPQNFGQGLAALGGAVFGAIGDRRLQPHEERVRDGLDQTLGNILRQIGAFGAGSGGGSPFGSPAVPRAAPAAPQRPATPPGFNIDPNRTAGFHSLGKPPQRRTGHVIV